MGSIVGGGGGGGGGGIRDGWIVGLSVVRIWEGCAMEVLGVRRQ